MGRILAAYRIDPALAKWIKEKAKIEERKINTVLERILRDAQERDEQSEKDAAHARN